MGIYINPDLHPNIVRTTPDAIASMFKRGERAQGQWPDLVGEAREMLYTLQEGQRGLVVGAGKNDLDWVAKGYETWDKDPTTYPHYVGDFTNAESTNPELRGAYDIVYCERIPFKTGKKFNSEDEYFEGIHPTRLIREAYMLLKVGGILVISTGWHTHPESELPDKDTFDIEIAKLGFGVVVSERDRFTTMTYPTILDGYDDSVIASSQSITYYAKKTSELSNPIDNKSNKPSIQHIF